MKSLKVIIFILFFTLLFGCNFPINNYFYNEFIIEEEDSKMAIDWGRSSNDCDLVCTVTGGGFITNCALANDGDDETYSQVNSTEEGAGEGIWTSTFAGPRYIAEFKFKVKGAVSGAPPPPYATVKFEYYDGAWHTLATDVQLTGTATWYNYTAGYTNVTKVRVTAGCYVLFNGPPRQSISFIYTITANGTEIVSGLKIKTDTAIIQIACEPLRATHKLRLKKAAAIVGIPLVATTDSWASPIRIYDGSSIKALMKFN